MEQLEAALAEYEQVRTDMGEADTSTAVRHNERFLRWLGGGSLR
jgi:hypothetical protein